MKGTRVLLATLLLMGSAACGGGEPEPSADERFIAALVEQDVIAGGLSDEVHQSLIDEGRAWCDNLTDPDTTRQMVEDALEQMTAQLDRETALKATLTMGTAAQIYCPDAAERLGA